jgi:hypothetical protein
MTRSKDFWTFLHRGGNALRTMRQNRTGCLVHSVDSTVPTSSNSGQECRIGSGYCRIGAGRRRYRADLSSMRNEEYLRKWCLKTRICHLSLFCLMFRRTLPSQGTTALKTFLCSSMLFAEFAQFICLRSMNSIPQQPGFIIDFSYHFERS